MTQNTFEGFKANLQTLEKRIGEATADQNNDIIVSLTWIDYVERGDATKDEEDYVIKEWVPKLIRAILNKRYDWQRIDFKTVINFIERLVRIIAKNLHQEYDDVYHALTLLMNPSHSFFTKYCTQKTEHVNIGAQGTNVPTLTADDAFIFSLEIGTWIDFFNEFNQWEIASVERFSEFKTEIVVSTQSDKKVWLSLDRDRRRIAPFGTYSANGGVAETTASVTTSAAPVQSHAAVDVTDESWRFNLSEGDLVDAKDGTNMWYQACIMELKKEIVVKEMDKDSSVEASSALPNINNIPANMNISVNSLDDMYDDIPAELTVTISAGVDVCNRIDDTVDDKVEQSQQPAHKIMARIAFIGLSEWSDDWIEITSDKIQKLNHFSSGRRGDLPIREEILFKVNVVSSQQGEIDKFAVYREGCFIQSTYIQLVNCFGSNGGFEAIITKLQQWKDTPSVRSPNRTKRLLQLITLVGPMHRVLTKSFLASFGLSYVELSTAILMNMSLQDIRETPIEILEPALNALEKIAIAHFGRNAAMGRLIEPMKLEVALSNMSSPYLNRRLAGLKILSDLFRRAEASTEYPSGLKITRPITNGKEQVNFRVVPILYHYNIATLSMKLGRTSVLRDIFVGGNAHESLMVRSSNVLCAMAEKNVLSDDLIEAIWIAGFAERKSEALKCLCDVTAHMHTHSFKVILRSLQSLDPCNVTGSVVDLTAAFALRCRELLMQCAVPDIEDMIEEYYPTSGSENTTRRHVKSPDVNESPTGQKTITQEVAHEREHQTDSSHLLQTKQEIRTVLRAYRKSVNTLWRWALDDSGASDAVALQSLQKIEAVIDMGTSFQVACDNIDFPWVMHWFRMKDLINDVVGAISSKKSVMPGLKVLQLCICSWPFSNSASLNDGCKKEDTPIKFLPFFRPNRFALADYLQESMGIIERVSSAAVYLKEAFDTEVLRISLDSETGLIPNRSSNLCASLYDAGIRSKTDFGRVIIPTSVQTALNGLKIGPSRVGYKESIERLMDFLHLFVRSTVNQLIPKDTIQNIWHAVVQRAVTADESDVVVNFCNRIVIKVQDGGSNNDNKNSVTDNATGTATVQKRTSVSSRSTIIWIFENLLCSGSFIESAFFSSRCLVCIEKWFRWLNFELAAMEECDSATKRRLFLQTHDPKSLIGLSVFPDIIVSSQSEKVAAAAVKFLTTLPQNLNEWMKSSAEDTVDIVKSNNLLITTFRSMLLNRCMTDLASLFKGMDKSSNNSKKSSILLRQLLFLEGILDESIANAGEVNEAILPHGCIGRGNPVIFKVSSTSKNIKQYGGELTIYRSQTVAELMNAVAQQVHLTVPEIKVFRLGKEINVAADGSKCISQLRLISDHDNLVVVERPASKMLRIETDTSANCVTSGADADHSAQNGVELTQEMSVSNSAPKDMKAEVFLPAQKLSRSDEYCDLLFGLLKRSQGEVCDKIWSLISRIPTFRSIMNKWLLLNCTNVEQFLFSFDKERTENLPMLVYQLQLIEALIQPVSSPAEFEKQCIHLEKTRGESDDSLDPALLRNWADKFITKGGFDALCKAFDWINATASMATSSLDGSNQCAITPLMLQLSFSLISKLLRAFFVRICSSQSVILKHFIARVLIDVKLGRALGKDSRNPFSRTLYTKYEVSEKNIDSKSLNEKETSEEKASGSRDDSGNQIDEQMVVDAISGEWGWRINWSCAPKEQERGISLPKIQANLLTLVINIRKLADHSYFNYYPDCKDTVVKTKINSRQDNLLSALDGMLIIWACCSSLDPNLLGKIPKAPDSSGGVDCKTIVKQLILGKFDRQNLNMMPNTEQSSYGMSVSLWFVQILSAIVHWTATANSSTHGSVSYNRISGSGWYVLVNRIIHTLLRYRPHIRVSSNDAARGAERLVDIEATSKPLFLLAASLLPILFESMSSCEGDDEELENTLLSASADMTKELLTLQNSHDESINRTVLEGNLQLLTVLIGKYEDKLHNVFTPSVQDFFICQCLGLESVEKSQSTAICEDGIIRSNLYELLNALTRRNPQRAAAVFGQLSSVHSKVPVPVGWEYRPEKESRSSTGYVGLRNLGSTCYMNSLLQVLYMNREIRDYFLNHLKFDIHHIGDRRMHIDELRNNIAFQLRKLFYALKHSKKKYYAPNDWAYAFKDESGIQPVDVMQQQDAQEFFQLLCERFERTMVSLRQSGHHNGPGSEHFDILQHAFGGKLCNQMFKTDSADSNIANVKKEVREHYEGFVCISLEVKGYKNLEHSLSKFVAGEQISDFVWEENAPRANITKRQCIADMSDTLVLHLKRFELNFDTFRREKVNDSFEFPLFINMLPYTKEGLEQSEHMQLLERLNSQGVKHQLASSIKLPHPSEYYEYELTGVVVHTGTSDSGHYFSYIRDPDDSGKWFEFNDQEVSNFSSLRLEAECFGGMTTTHEYVQSTQSIYTNEVVNPKSAYMLIYSRVKHSNNSRSVVSTADEDASVCEEILKLEKQIERENTNHLISLRILTAPHLSFFTSLVDDMFQQAQHHIPHMHAVLHGLHLAEFGAFVAKYLARSYAVTVFKNACGNLDKYAEAYQAEFNKYIASLAEPNNKSHYSSVVSPPPPPPSHISDEANTAILPPPPSYNEAAASSGEDYNSMPPFPHFGLPYDEHLLPRDDHHAIPITAQEVLLAEWMLDFDLLIVGNLFASTEEVRKNSASFFFRVVGMVFAQYGRKAFAPSDRVNVMNGLLSISCMDGGTSARPVHVSNADAVVISETTSSQSPMDTAVAITNVDQINIVEEGSDVAVAVPANDIIDFDADGEEMDEDLALAIKMSKAGASGSPIIPSTVPVVVAENAVAAVSPSDHHASNEGNDGDVISKARERGIYSIHSSSLLTSTEDRVFLLCNFLVELTTSSRIALAGENWRKVSSYLWLLLEIAKLDLEIRRFFLKRELVAQLVDILLGEQSPLMGQLYKKGSRRHAPSSFVAVGHTQDGSLPYAAKNIPDWTYLVELLSLLVCSSGSLSMVADMGDISHQCLMYKSLFSTLFRQARYMPPTITMMKHLLYENRLFTDLIAESLFEEFSLCNAEGTAHVFNALETYLSISDSLRFHRYVSVLGSGAFNILEVMRSACIQQHKERLVCVFISSFCSLVRNIPDIQQTMAGSATTWAPWMLKFCYQYMNMCSVMEASSEDTSSANQPMIGPQPAPALLNEVKASNGSVSDAKKTKQDAQNLDQGKTKGVTFQDEIAVAASARKGPFMIVYGEDETQRYLSWHDRAQKTNQMLYDLLIHLGQSPEILIPADTFTLPPSPPSAAAAASNGAMPLNMQLADGMSDEELALLLQQETLNNDID